MRRSPLSVLLLSAGILTLTGLTVWLLIHEGFAWAGNASGIGGFLLAAVGAIAGLLARWFGRPEPIGVAGAADRLAAAFKRRWEEEDRIQRVDDPLPLPVRWAAIEPRKAGIGGFGDIRELFAGITAQRLVILGRAGAGKSVLATRLAEELLAVREPGGRVPVILPAATWDPAMRLPDWIAAQLIRGDHALSARLKDPDHEQQTLAEALAQDMVLPVIDGLDELPEHLRALAITQINAAGSKLPLVLTSRAGEYADATSAAGRGVSRATVIELLPLAVEDIKDYLRQATSQQPPDRWHRVFRDLDANPDGSVASVLTNPLMLWLARTVYEFEERDPAELVTDAGQADEETIENHLLDAYLPAVYAGSGSPRYRWTAGQAGRWLAFLAAFLERTGEQDAGWWSLCRAARSGRIAHRAVRRGVMAGVAWGLAVWVLWHGGEWADGRYRRREPLRILLLNGPFGPVFRHDLYWVFSRLHGFTVSDAATLFSAIGTLMSWHSLPLFAAKIAVISLLYGLLRNNSFAKAAFALLPPKALSGSPGVRRTIAALAVQLPFDCARALILLVLTHSAALFIAILGAQLVLGFLAAFATPADLTRTTRPARTLRNDRGVSVYLRALTIVNASGLVWLFCGPVIALIVAAFYATEKLYEVLLGNMNLLSQPSDVYSGARIVLACTRRMPLRTMTFLADAQRRGVLRQSGAAYRFRHIRLRQRLAQLYAGPADQVGAVLLGQADDYAQRKIKAGWKLPDWLPRSNAPRFGAVWAHRFAEEASAVQAEVGAIAPAGRAYQAGPGLARRYAGDDGRVWAMCALPSQRPVLVASSVWQALWQAAGKTPGNEGLKALGLPQLNGELAARQRIITPEATRIRLGGGSWDAGALIRDNTNQAWYWAPVPELDGQTKVVLWYLGWNKPCVQALTTVTIPWERARRRVVRQIRDQAISLLAGGTLTRAMDALAASRADAGPPQAATWRRLLQGLYRHQFGCEYLFRNQDDDRTLTAMTGLVCKTITGQLTAEVRVQLFRAYQEDTRYSPDEISALFSAGWDTCAGLLSLAARTAHGGGAAGPARVTLSLATMDPDHAGPELPLAESRQTLVRIQDKLRLSPEQRDIHIQLAVTLMAHQLGSPGDLGPGQYARPTATAAARSFDPSSAKTCSAWVLTVASLLNR